MRTVIDLEIARKELNFNDFDWALRYQDKRKWYATSHNFLILYRAINKGTHKQTEKKQIINFRQSEMKITNRLLKNCEKKLASRFWFVLSRQDQAPLSSSVNQFLLRHVYNVWLMHIKCDMCNKYELVDLTIHFIWITLSQHDHKLYHCCHWDWATSLL